MLDDVALREDWSLVALVVLSGSGTVGSWR